MAKREAKTYALCLQMCANVIPTAKLQKERKQKRNWEEENGNHFNELESVEEFIN